MIAQAFANKKRVALGRVVLTTREHPVMLEPFGGGLLMTTLRAADEVRAAEFDFEGEADEQKVELAESIMDRLEGEWDASKFHDGYQDALRALIEAKEKQLPIPKAGPARAATNVVDLMAVLKQSLAQTNAAQAETPRKAKTSKKARADRRQRSMLLPVTGGGEKAAAREEKPAKPARRRKAS